MHGSIILYDNPSRFGTGTCWSLNVWKIRMLLNFKGLQYETVWVDGPDTKPLFQSFGLAPNKPGVAVADYSIPTVRMPNGSYIMESKRIAWAIEALHPEPSVHLSNPVIGRVQDSWLQILSSLVPVLVPRMPVHVLRGPTIEFHKAARMRDYGMPLTELEAKYGGEKAWKKGEAGLKSWVDVLSEDRRGPFCLGDKVSYADFVIVGFLEYCRVLGGGCLERVLQFDGVFGELYEACKPWLARNDH